MDRRKLEKLLLAQGFKIERTTGGHFLIRSPIGDRVATLAGTPSDHRSVRNALAQLRRAGLHIPRKGQ